MGAEKYRIRFETKDGCLIVNRSTSSFVDASYLRTDRMFLSSILNNEARSKGVRVVSHEIRETELFAIVDWL